MLMTEKQYMNSFATHSIGGEKKLVLQKRVSCLLNTLFDTPAAMAHHTSNTGRLQTLQSLERDSNWGQSLRVKGKAGGKGRAPLEVPALTTRLLLSFWFSNENDRLFRTRSALLSSQRPSSTLSTSSLRLLPPQRKNLLSF